MEIDEFNSKVSASAAKHPRLLALERDRAATEDMISRVEDYYQMPLPKPYKQFVQCYGGGYFGFVLVFSCDAEGGFYLPNHADKDWVAKHAFLPVIDLETGDFGGFPIQEGIAQNTVAWYDHEEEAWREADVDFFEILLQLGLKVSQ